MSSAQILTITGQMPDNGFIRFIRLCVKCKKVENFLSEEFLYGAVVHHTFSCNLGSGCSVILLPEDW
jgi:hypothetical protein